MEKYVIKGGKRLQGEVTISAAKNSAVAILPAACLIGVTTFVCSALGVKIGAVFGARFRAAAERAGGVVLILIGVKTLLSGLGIL